MSYWIMPCWVCPIGYFLLDDNVIYGECPAGYGLLGISCWIFPLGNVLLGMLYWVFPIGRWPIVLTSPFSGKFFNANRFVHKTSWRNLTHFVIFIPFAGSNRAMDCEGRLDIRNQKYPSDFFWRRETWGRHLRKLTWCLWTLGGSSYSADQILKTVPRDVSQGHFLIELVFRPL